MKSMQKICSTQYTNTLALAFHWFLHLIVSHVHELHDEVALVQQKVVLH